MSIPTHFIAVAALAVVRAPRRRRARTQRHGWLAAMGPSS